MQLRLKKYASALPQRFSVGTQTAYHLGTLHQVDVCEQEPDYSISDIANVAAKPTVYTRMMNASHDAGVRRFETNDQARTIPV